MEIIPVIDLRDGKAVLANAKSRDQYPAVQTPLCPDPDPVHVATKLVRAVAARRLYIADLNAIMGTGENQAAINRISQNLADIELWVDDGRLPPDRHPNHAVTTVYGTEVISNGKITIETKDVLSLDYQSGHLRDLLALPDHIQALPKRVICMTLNKIGRLNGFDEPGLRNLVRKFPQCDIFIAGGIRNKQDLLTAKRAGAAGALIATAIHQLHINLEILNSI